jgi:hypothetical protein
LLNLRWRDVDLDTAEVRITGSAAVIGGQRVEGRPRAAGPAPSVPTPEPPLTTDS